MATVRFHLFLTFSTNGVCFADIMMTLYIGTDIDGYGMRAWDNRLRLMWATTATAGRDGMHRTA